jgi:hypothetical protein
LPHHWPSQGMPSWSPSIFTPGQCARKYSASAHEVIWEQYVLPSQENDTLDRSDRRGSTGVCVGSNAAGEATSVVRVGMRFAIVQATASAARTDSSFFKKNPRVKLRSNVPDERPRASDQDPQSVCEVHAAAPYHLSKVRSSDYQGALPHFPPWTRARVPGEHPIAPFHHGREATKIVIPLRRDIHLLGRVLGVVGKVRAGLEQLRRGVWSCSPYALASRQRTSVLYADRSGSAPARLALTTKISTRAWVCSREIGG